MEVVEERREGGIVSNDNDDDECRICRLPGESENPLSYPCACRGTIKFVHQDCLLQWLNRRKISRCEVCKHVYSFAPLYAENAPTRLPPREFVIGVAFKATNVLRLLLRIAYAILVWLLLIPLVTSWVWKLAFVRSYSEAQRLFRSRMSVSMICSDYLRGFLLYSALVYIFFGFTSWVYFTWVRRGIPGLANMNFARNGNDEGAGGGQGFAGIGQTIRRNVENVVAWWEMQAARFLARSGLIGNAALNELIGMRAPLFHFDENAFAVLASNIIFIAVLVFVPFSLGRIVSFPLLWLVSYAKSAALSSLMPQTESPFPLANITLNNALSAFTFLSSNSQGNNMPSKVSDADRTGLDRVSDSSTSPLSANLFNRETARMPNQSDDTTLLIGYMGIFSFILIYIGTVFMMHYAQGEPLIMRRLFVITFIRETSSSLARKFFEAIRQFTSMVHTHFRTTVKVAFILAIELGLLPLMCGWWLDVCTVRMFGQTITRRVESFAEHPVWTSFLHWIVGILYGIGLLLFVKFLEMVLPNGGFIFQWGRDNPDNNPFHKMIKAPVHKHVRLILLSIGIHGSLIVMLVYLPVKLVMLFAPSVFPLDLSFSASFDNSFSVSFVDRLLFQYGIPCAARYFYPSATVRAFVHKWISVVGSVLGLSDFLLPKPEDDGVQENRNAEPLRFHRQHNVQEVVLAIAEGPGVVTYAPRFALRIVLLLVLAWMTLLLFTSTMIAVPILLGRALHTSISRLPIIPEIKLNDLYAFTIGSCIMRAVLIIARYAIEHVQTGRTVILLKQILEWSSIALRSTALLSIWIFVIPILMGLLFDLMVIVPILVPLDESPIFSLFQDWVMGLVFLHIWAGLVLVDRLELFADRSWQVKLQRVLDDGLPRLHALWVLQEILIPITMNLLTALSVPYVFTRGVFPMLGYPPVVNSAIHRFAWPSCFAFNVMWFFAKLIHIWVIYLHNSIRDDRYRIGQRLRNYGEDSEEKKNEM